MCSVLFLILCRSFKISLPRKQWTFAPLLKTSPGIAMPTSNAVSLPALLESSKSLKLVSLYCVVDETRVILTPIEGAEHDYINANFIDVSKTLTSWIPLIKVCQSVAGGSEKRFTHKLRSCNSCMKCTYTRNLKAFSIPIPAYH